MDNKLTAKFDNMTIDNVTIPSEYDKDNLIKKEKNAILSECINANFNYHKPQVITPEYKHYIGVFSEEKKNQFLSLLSRRLNKLRNDMNDDEKYKIYLNGICNNCYVNIIITSYIKNILI